MMWVEGSNTVKLAGAGDYRIQVRVSCVEPVYLLVDDIPRKIGADFRYLARVSCSHAIKLTGPTDVSYGYAAEIKSVRREELLDDIPVPLELARKKAGRAQRLQQRLVEEHRDRIARQDLMEADYPTLYEIEDDLDPPPPSPETIVGDTGNDTVTASPAESPPAEPAAE